MASDDKRHSLPFILHQDLIDDFLPRIGKEQWQPLYVSGDVRPDRFGLFSALLKANDVASALAHDSWDLRIGDGRPGFSQGWDQGKEVTTYHRYGGLGTIRPLVVYRDFYGAFPSYLELCEEFVHYHNLAHDHKRGVLLDFDRSGYDIEVARIKPALVEASTKYLRRFQAGTHHFLGIYVDAVRYSKLPLDDVPKDQRTVEVVTGTTRYRRDVVECDHMEGYATFSRFLLKVLLPPPPQNEGGIWPYEQNDDDREVSFIIRVDEKGNAVEHTSNPDTLKNYFGANPHAPHYLTPVYFRREVLSKYYADPDRYTVSDGHLSCLSIWGVRIDNDLPAQVVVFLGDLGRDLPYEERLHWRQFNVPPAEGISETNYKRSFLAQFTDPKAPDLAFKHEYERLVTAWATTHGWPLFRPLGTGDEHLLDTLRIPLTNSQSELDDQVLTLTKLMVDSLNEDELEARSGGGEKGAKGITKLETFFKSTDFKEKESVITFLRNLQDLRSSGSGHRKGKRYAALLADLGVDIRRKPDIMVRLLTEGIGVLKSLQAHFCP